MMLKVRRAILGQREKRGIDLSTHDGQSFMNSTWPWKLLWSSFLKEVNDLKLAALSRTSTATKGHQTRSDELLSRDWEEGGSFASTSNQSSCKKEVLAELEKRSDKKIGKAERILSGIISDLAKEGLDECNVLSSETGSMVAAFTEMVDKSKTIIKGLSRNYSDRTCSILASFCAIMMPSTTA